MTAVPPTFTDPVPPMHRQAHGHHIPLKFARSLDEYVDRDVAVTLTGVEGMMVMGRFYGVTYDIDGHPITLLLRDEGEQTLTIPWHAIAMLAHVSDELRSMMAAADAAGDTQRPPE